MRRVVLSVLAAALVAGCTAPVTTLDVTWVAPQVAPAKSYKKLLIITVAANEFVQEAFQKEMAAELQKRGVNAVASGRYFTRYTDAERDRFKRSVEQSDADHILLARVTTTSTKVLEDRGTIMGAAGTPYGDATSVTGAFARYVYPGSYAAGADASMTDVTAEASIFAAKGEKLVWSARTRTTNARSTTGAHLAPQYVNAILDAMKKDKVI
jgi:hypothetical protein